jgi:acetyl esterase
MLDQQTPHHEKITGLRDPLLTAENCQTFSRYYFADIRDAASPLASPLLAEDLSRLPGATVVTAELDPLAAEAQRYIQRLRASNVAVNPLHYPGQVHDFPLFIKAQQEAREAARKIGQHLNTLFDRT